MPKRLLALLFCIPMISCSNKQEVEKITSREPATIENITGQGIWSKINQQKGKKAVLVNFWATWCKPCVEELPDFIAMKNKHPDNLEVILVSFDFKKQKAEKLINDWNVEFTTYFKEQNDNEFFATMPDEWTGELPFTMIFNQEGERLHMISDKISHTDLENYITEALKQ